MFRFLGMDWSAECGVADFNEDGAVDQIDFAEMQRNLSYTGN
jgi:hypothetical protein